MILVFSLGACSNKLVATACPPIKHYTQQFQDDVYEGVASLDENSRGGQAIISVIDDYRVLRNQLAHCQSQY